jgi:opacity protein-like surface antigen
LKIVSAILVLLISLELLLAAGPSYGEDSDRLRPYLRFHSGDISSTWKVYDMWSFALGANFDRHWGAELGIDFYEKDFKPTGSRFGEVGALHLVPQVRLRKPFLDNRLVPYMLVGAGVSFLQFNDEKEPAFGHRVKINTGTFTVTAGAGLEYFIADNVTLGFEGKYFWLQPAHGSVDGRKVDVDLSAPAFTVGIRAYLDENRPRPLADTQSQRQGRFYFGVRMGGSVLTDSRWTQGVQLETESSSFGSVNQTGGLLFGWDFSRNWGVELAADSDEFRMSLDGLGQVGEYGMGILIPQARYRIPLDNGRWVPYVTAGMGIAYSEFNDKAPNGYGHDFKGSGIYPACSVGAGVDYFLIRNISLLADVGWFTTWGHKMEVDNRTLKKGDFSAFMFHVGFRVYLFD